MVAGVAGQLWMRGDGSMSEWLGCTGESIDLIVDDPTLILVQDVVPGLDSLGHILSYTPALTTTSEPVFLLQEPPPP